MRENRPLLRRVHRLAALVGQLAQQLGLVLVELRRHLDDELGPQVAPPPPLQPWHAPTAQHELLARLRAGRDDQLLVAVERRQRHGRAERGLGDRDRHVGDQVVAVAPSSARARRPAGGRTGRRPCRRGRPAAPRPPRRSVEPESTPAGTSTWYVCSTRHPALATARRARRDDHLAEPAAARARCRRDHLAEQALANPLDLTAAAAVGARDGLRARPGAAAVAVLAAAAACAGSPAPSPRTPPARRRCRRRPPCPGRAAVRSGRAGRPPPNGLCPPKKASNRSFSPPPPPPKTSSTRGPPAPPTPASPKRS